MKKYNCNSSVDFSEVYELLLETFNPVPTLFVWPEKRKETYTWVKNHENCVALGINIGSVEEMKNAIRAASKNMKKENIRLINSFNDCLFSARSGDLYQAALTTSKYLGIPCPIVYIGSKNYMKNSYGMRTTHYLGNHMEYVADYVYVMVTDRKTQRYIIAHEIRHCWQHEKAMYTSNYYYKPDENPLYYVLQDSEIDAEAFASFFVKYQYDINARQLLSEEKELVFSIKGYEEKFTKRFNEIANVYRVA